MIETRKVFHIRWIPLRVARQHVADVHRHLPKVVGGVIALGAFDGERLAGVIILGRPSARMLDCGEVLEVVRCATDGTPNSGSALYARARRLAHLLGVRLITYTLPSESGASLRGAGWIEDGVTAGGEWTRATRPRGEARQSGPKVRWRAKC